MDRTRTKRIPASHQHSKLLNLNENARVHNKLLRKQQALQTAVVQLVRSSRGGWIKDRTGALVIMKDSTRRSYYLSLYTISADDRDPIWEQEIYSNFNLKKSRPFFLQFSGTDQQMGINFADDSEADAAFQLILDKASKRNSVKTRVNGGLQVKPLTGGEQYHSTMHKGSASSSSLSQRNTMGNMSPHMSASNTSIDSGFHGTADKTSKTKSKTATKGRLTALDISAPDTSTFKHLRGVQIGATGQMTQIGNAKSNDPHMQDIKTLLQDMKIATSDKQAEEMLNDPQQSEGIYQFIEQRGGLNEVKRAYRNESIRPTRQPAKQPPPPAYFNKDPPVVHVKREITGLPPPPPPSRPFDRPGGQMPPPTPVRRESMNMSRPPKYNPSNNPIPAKHPPPPPGNRNKMPPPSPAYIGNHALPPSNKPRGPPPSLPQGGPPPPPAFPHGGPPPPPISKPGPPPPPPPANKPGPPPPPPANAKPISDSKPAGAGDAGRSAFLDQIAKGKTLRTVDGNSRDNSPRQSVHDDGAGGMAEQLKAVLSQIRPKVGSDDEEDQGADSDEWDDSD